MAHVMAEDGRERHTTSSVMTTGGLTMFKRMIAVLISVVPLLAVSFSTETAVAHPGAPVIDMNRVAGKAKARARSHCSAAQAEVVWECLRDSVEVWDCLRGGYEIDNPLYHPERGLCHSSYVRRLHEPTSPNNGRYFYCEATSAYFVRWVPGSNNTRIKWYKWRRYYTGFSCQRMPDS